MLGIAVELDPKDMVQIVLLSRKIPEFFSHYCKIYVCSSGADWLGMSEEIQLPSGAFYQVAMLNVEFDVRTLWFNKREWKCEGTCRSFGQIGSGWVLN